MGNRQLIRGLGASKRTATGVILTTVAVVLVASGCDSEPTPSEEVVAAGDIASCRTEGDEATAELVEGIDGTVLALGDEGYLTAETVAQLEAWALAQGQSPVLTDVWAPCPRTADGQVQVTPSQGERLVQAVQWAVAQTGAEA